MNPQTDLPTVFIDSAVSAYRLNKSYADKAISQLPDDKLHVSLDPNTNSIAVIMKHVAGNLISRFTDFLTADGEKPWRNRDDEFVDTFQSRAEVSEYWEKGWRTLFHAIQDLKPDDLLRIVEVRGERHTVPLAIDRSLAHTAYHIGQIVMIARILAGDSWQTITIPRGGSDEFNKRVWGRGS